MGRLKSLTLTSFALLGVTSLTFLAPQAFANTLPDPTAGVAGGGLSTQITSTSFQFTLGPCPGTDGCSLLTNPQAAFAGENDSGVAWGTLTLTLDFPAITSLNGVGLTCDGGTLFTLNNCPQTVPFGATSVTFTLSKGAGTGIGCYDSDGDVYDTNCLLNSIQAEQNGGSYYDNPNDTTCASHFYEVCGPSNFAIGVGFDSNPWPSNSIPTGGTGQANVPEPSTFALSSMGLLGLLLASFRLRASRKRHA